MLDVFIAFAALASGTLANKFLLKSISPDLFAGIRMFISGMLLFVSSVFRSSSRLRWAYVRADMVKLLLISFCASLVPAILKAYALTNLPASKYALWGSLDPFITAVYAYILWNERLSWKKIVGIALGITGIAIYSISTSPAEVQWGELFYLSFPELAIIGSTVASRYGWILVQMMLKKDRYSPVEMNSLTMLLSGVIGIGFAAMRGTSLFVGPAQLGSFVGVFAFTIIVGNLFGYTMYSYALKKHSAVWVSLAGLSIPPFIFLGSNLLSWEGCSLSFFVALFVLMLGFAIFYFDEIRGAKTSKRASPVTPETPPSNS